MEKLIITIVIATATKCWTVTTEASYFREDIGQRAMCNRVRKATLASVNAVLKLSRFHREHPIQFLSTNWMEKVQVGVNRRLFDQNLSQVHMVEPVVKCQDIQHCDKKSWDFRISETDKAQPVQDENFLW